MQENFVGTERYELVRKLGEGGMGAVHLVYDREREFHIALKTLLDTTPQHLQRLKNEFRALADIVHPNLVRFYELEAQSNHWFITMEYIDGISFMSHVSRANIPSTNDSATFLSHHSDKTITISEVFKIPLDPATQATRTCNPKGICTENGRATQPIKSTYGVAVDYDLIRRTLGEICLGLQAVHAAGKLHCDIKPSNVLIGGDQRAVLLDFGLVTEYRRSGESSSDSDIVVGTVEYMSPEQAMGLALTPATDWYSVGVLLFQALIGEVPFRGKATQVLRAKVEWDAVVPTVLNPNVPADLSRLCTDLLARRPSDRPCGSDILRILKLKMKSGGGNSPALTTNMPFVGRHRHLNALKKAFDSVIQDKRAYWAYVHGRSGMGKTVLVKTFLDELKDTGQALIFAGRCHQCESVPFKALDGFVDDIVAYLTTLPESERISLLPQGSVDLARVFPVFSQLLGIVDSLSDSGASYNLEGSRRNAFAALAELLRRLGQRGPLVIVVDDLQWGDLDSVQFFLKLLKAIEPFPFLFVGTYRTKEADNAILAPLLAAESTVVTRLDIAVSPLLDEEARVLAQTLLPSTMANRGAIADAIIAEAQGSPYFIAELVHASRQDIEANQSGNWSLDEALYHRISALPESAQRLLQVVSVAGGPIFQVAAFAVAALSPQQTSVLLPMLRSQRLVQTSGIGKLDSIEIFHDRIRETVVDRLSPDLLQTIHRGLAVHLENLDGVAPEMLVAHYQGAREHEKAAKYAIQAAHHALSTLAFEQAATLYRLALALIDETHPDRQDLRLRFAEALSGAGHGGQASNAYLEAAKFSPPHQALQYKQRASEALLHVGQFEQGLRICEEVLAAVGAKLPKTHASTFVYLLWQRLLLRIGGMKLRKRTNIAPEEVLIAKTFTSVAMGLSMFEIGAATIQVRALRRSLRLGDRDNAAVNLALEAGFQACGGYRAEKRVRAISAYARELADGSDDAWTLAMLKICEGISAHLLGYWRASLEACQQARVMFRRCSHTQWGANQALNFEYSGLYYLGDFSRAIRHFDQSISWATERNDLYLKTLLGTGYHSILDVARTNDPQAALASSDELNATWRPNHFDSVSFYEVLARANINLYEDKGGDAWQHVVSSWGSIRRAMFFWVELAGVEMYDLRARCALATARCALATARRGSSRKTRLKHAMQLARKIERTRVGRPMASLIRAQAAWLQDNVDAARAYLVDSLREFEAVDMAIHAAVARRRLGELIGGDQGQQKVAAANAFFAAQSIANPDSFVMMHAPGFESNIAT